MIRSIVATTLALIVAWPASALADDASRALYDQCQSGRITGKFTQKQYKDALRNIQTDLEEYTDCADVIRRAQLAAAGRAAATRSPGARAVPGSDAPASATPPPMAPGESSAQILTRATPDERTALDAMRKPHGGSLLVGGITLTPASSRPPKGAANQIPAPLALALALGGVALVAAAGSSLRRTISSRRHKSS